MQSDENGESPSSMLKCPWCNDMFNSVETLKFHKSTQHFYRNSEEQRTAGTLSQKCPYCSKGFKGSSGLQHHMKVKHYYGVFRCEACRLKVYFATEIVRHLQQGLNSIENKF